MGLLDEAIREHLELQRKRGGDPTDLARQEQEALGPAVREADEAAPAAEQAVADPAPAPEAPPTLEPAVPDPEGPPAHHPGPDDALQPDPEAPPPPAEPEAAAPTPPEPEPEPEPAPSTSQETAVFDVDDVFAEEDAAREEDEKPPADEDVLEETPEFLQETPEHDRLWFEQKPPKDFDFDG
jgi:hypothetical protein